MERTIASMYKITAEIGSGGGGRVYLAEHLRLGKKVVLKEDKRTITTGSDLLRREVDVLKNLKHIHIPRVYDFVVEDEKVYTVMEYIEGESLDKALRRGERFSQAQVITWALQLLDALCYLHSPIHGEPPHGYVHSDIKPANLMRMPDNEISLIDFNVSLALGEDNAVGCSAGYASPEHYGLDFSFYSGDSATVDDYETVTLNNNSDRTLTITDRASQTSGKKVVPDVRSDIYSVGATMYHLLSGKRPSTNVMDVVPLSEKEFNPQIVRIIAKAMYPNPDLRYQTAEEMLSALTHLYDTDERTLRFKKNRIKTWASLAVCLCAGIMLTMVGLRRMQLTENSLKLAEYAQTALADGDTDLALEYALQALSGSSSIIAPAYPAEAQKALTDALGVYDLADGYQEYKIVELPDNPLYLSVSPDGRTAACVYSAYVAVFDTETAVVLVSLPAEASAHSEAEFLDDHTIVYAGEDGICAYSIADEKTLWSGEAATAVAISQDGETVAAVYKDESCAYVYRAETGEIVSQVDFGDHYQSVAVNDSFANPNDNLFELNEDGTKLAVSFEDGSLKIYDLSDSGETITVFDETSGYTHFEGGFYEQYFAFSASDSSGSVFAIIDADEVEQTGGFESESSFHAVTDENGIYVQTENLLVQIDPLSGDQTPLVTTAENLSGFAVSETHTIAVSENQIMIFDSNAELTESFEQSETKDFVAIANGVALIGSMNTNMIRILKYEEHADAEVFSYDASYEHDEARISADGETVMLFSYLQFRIYKVTGELVIEVSIPNAEQVYDQQYIREDGESYLEVTYNDGTVVTYDAGSGEVISEEIGEAPDSSLYEEFYTDTYRIESGLDSIPVVFDNKTGRKICELEEEGYLTYVTQADDYIILQFYTTDEMYYGLVLNEDCETIAYLPGLCDVYENELYFDYSTGNLRKSQIYNIDELITMAEN